MLPKAEDISQQPKGQDNAQTEQAQQQPEKKLGLSKVVYGLGMSARDGIITVVAGTAALFPVFYFGQDKFKTLEKVSKWPERVKETWHKSLGEKAGKASSALTVSVGLAFLASHFTNLPGLVIGARKVKEAEDRFNSEVESNAQLTHENQVLADQLKHQSVALADAEKKIEQLGGTTSPAKKAQGGFSEKFATTGKSNAEKVSARRDSIDQTSSLGA